VGRIGAGCSFGFGRKRGLGGGWKAGGPSDGFRDGGVAAPEGVLNHGARCPGRFGESDVVSGGGKDCSVGNGVTVSLWERACSRLRDQSREQARSHKWRRRASAVEPVASALLLVDAGLFAPLFWPEIEVDAGAVALERADEGFAAEVADEAVDLAGLRGGDDFERQTWARFGFSSCVT